MSTKRVANSKLDHENWDQEEEAEEAGTFKRAAADELKTRVIKTARRKVVTGDDDGKKNAFSGFTGFGLTKPDSTVSQFSFLAKIASAAPVTPKQPEIVIQPASASKQSEYHSQLIGLNQGVLNWIKTHVESNPLCILTPILDDYHKFLKEIQNKYNNKDEASPVVPKISLSETKIAQPTDENKNVNSTFSGFKFTSVDSFKPAVKIDETPVPVKPTSMSEFKFSSTPASVEPPKPTGLAGFKFGAIQPISTNSEPPKPFSASSGITFGLGSNSTAPTSTFSMAKPFSFANVAAPATEEKKDDEVDEDAPPKVEFIENEEKDSVFSKKCKLFVKQDGNFTDRGVGTLHIKPVKDADKTQVIIRAGTTLGTILLNIMLTESVPLQRMGKNNVMMICIPTPDSKPPPTSILVRVKTGEEADELLETLKKYVK